MLYIYIHTYIHKIYIYIHTPLHGSVHGYVVMRTAHCASWSEGSSLGLAKAGKRSFGRRANVGFGLWGSFKGSFSGALRGPFKALQ